MFRYQADRIIQCFQIPSTFSVVYPENTYSWLSAFIAPSTAFFQINHKQLRKESYLDFLIHIFKHERYNFSKEMWLLGKNTIFFPSHWSFAKLYNLITFQFPWHFL